MRILTPGSGEMFRWQFSANGDFKGFKNQHFEVSDDGKVMLDCTRWAELIEICEKGSLFVVVPNAARAEQFKVQLHCDSGKINLITKGGANRRSKASAQAAE